MVRFRATIQQRGPHPFLDVPPSVVDDLAGFADRRRVRVTGRIQGAEFNATLMPVKNGGHVLYVPGGLRALTGVKVGDTVTVDIEPLSSQQTSVPGDLSAALGGAAGAMDRWDVLSASYRRELVRFLEDARTTGTRARRIMQIVAHVQGEEVLSAGRRTGHALWTCPSCGQRFVTENLNHSCAKHDLDKPFRTKPENILRLFDAVRQAVESLGPVTLVPYRDRVAFMVRVRFAGVKPRKESLDVEFWLPRRIKSPRFHRVETLSPTTHLYTVRLTQPADVDRELTGWLREAYAVGRQEHLKGPQPTA